MSFFKAVKSDIINYNGDSLKLILWLFLFDKSFRLLFSHRLMVYLQSTKFKFLNRWLNYRQQIKFNCYISVDAKIGKNIRFAHAFGIVIGPAVIKDNVTIFQDVTIGSHGDISKSKSYPIIGQGSKLFSGCKIIGDVNIGENCLIGANTVINKDVEANAIVVNYPPKIVGYTN